VPPYGRKPITTLSVRRTHDQYLYSPVNIQARAQSAPALPYWFGKIILIVQHLQRRGVLKHHRRTGVLCPRKLASSLAATFLSSLMGRRGVLLDKHWPCKNNTSKLMEVCSMAPLTRSK